MKRIVSFLLAVSAAVLTGCAGLDPMSHLANAMMGNADLMMQRQRISTKFHNNPDTDAWLEQRRKIALAIGDRTFDNNFGRVFDSVVLAVSSLELKVDNMERQSGYIAASGIALPPTDAKALQRQAMNDWCAQNGFDPALLERPTRSSVMANATDATDFGGMMSRYDTMQKGLNFQLIKIGENRTEVKLRFSDVYFPAEVEAFYKLIWQAVDKQIFIDQNLEGKVERRF